MSLRLKNLKNRISLVNVSESRITINPLPLLSVAMITATIMKREEIAGGKG